MKNAGISLAAVCVLVVGVYAYAAYSGFMATPDQPAADAHYNQLVEGFQAGQLSLKKEAPPGLMRLADPYNPTASAPYRSGPAGLHDLSYYKGRLYLYFGVTPALILFWPFAALTGHYLYDGQAVVIFCALGFLGSVGIVYALRRRYFSEASVWVVAACALALGLAAGVPMLLPPSNVNEVAISCGYMLTMLALGAVWCTLHEPERRGWWLVAASLAYGLAVGARPSLLFGAVILLVPVAQAWRERRPIGAQLLAATGPIMLIGLGLMLYNARRFDNAFEFGWRYQLNGNQQITGQPLSLHYLWFNFRVYFLELTRWSARFPFMHEIALPPLPAGYGQAEAPFGVLTNIPLVWLALAVPLAWRNRSREEASILRWFAAATALLFGTSALTVGLFWSAVNRYEVDFLPALLMLAVIGILGLEHALIGQPVRRRVARWAWGVLLGFSVASNLLASVERCAEKYDYAGISMWELGRMPEAINQYQEALRLNPDSAEAHNNLALVLARLGKFEDAIKQYQEALRLDPDLVGAHYNLGNTLAQAGRIEEAIAHYEQDLRIRPDYAAAHNNLGLALAQTGKIEEAIAHYEQALRIRPDYAGAHYNLGNALAQVGRVPEAVEHLQRALRLKPDFTQAQTALARLQARQ